MALTPSNSHGPGGTAASPDVVVGNVASGVADSGAPVKVGGKYNATPPVIVDGQRSDLNVDARGNARIIVMNGLNAALVAGQGSDAQSAAGLVSLQTANVNLLMNGTTVDRQRGNVEATLLASAARTATTSSADQTNYNGRGVQIAINVTAEAGATTLTLTVQGKDPIAGTYYDLITGIVVYSVAADSVPTLRAVTLYPGVLNADAIGAGAANLISQKSVLLPRTWRATITPNDASSQTYSLSAVTIL